jgi:putative protein-disulfide isomerase
MMKAKLIYCFDAWCGWCYGFSKVMVCIQERFKDQMDFEALSGGMLLHDQAPHISEMAGFIAEHYKIVEDTCGVKFGDDFLWHIFNSNDSDWYPESLTAARAISIFKQLLPDRQIEIASKVQKALYAEGRDLSDPEAYHHLTVEWGIDFSQFLTDLASDESLDAARHDFSLYRQLQVSGFPAVFVQVADLKFYQVAKGYTHEDVLEYRIGKVIGDL